MAVQRLMTRIVRDIQMVLDWWLLLLLLLQMRMRCFRGMILHVQLLLVRGTRIGQTLSCDLLLLQWISILFAKNDAARRVALLLFTLLKRFLARECCGLSQRAEIVQRALDQHVLDQPRGQTAGQIEQLVMIECCSGRC